MRISDWSSDVCSSDLAGAGHVAAARQHDRAHHQILRLEIAGRRHVVENRQRPFDFAILRQHESQCHRRNTGIAGRSEEHTSELQSLMRISYAVFCLKKKTQHKTITTMYN